MAGKWRAGLVALTLLAAARGVRRRDARSRRPPRRPVADALAARRADPRVAPTPSPSPSESGDLGAVVELTTRPAAYIEGKASREEVYGAILGNLGEDPRRRRPRPG